MEKETLSYYLNQAVKLIKEDSSILQDETTKDIINQLVELMINTKEEINKEEIKKAVTKRITNKKTTSKKRSKENQELIDELKEKGLYAELENGSYIVSAGLSFNYDY